jgi:hypothetical protein
MDALTLTNREVASIVWFGAVLALMAVVIVRARGTDTLAKLLRAVFARVFVVLFAAYAAWTLLGLVLAAQVVPWHSALAKDALQWAVPGTLMLAHAIDERREPGFLRRRVREAIWYPALLEAYTTFGSFGLGWELVLPVLVVPSVFVGMAAMVAPDMPGKRVANLLLGAYVLIVVAGATSTAFFTPGFHWATAGTSIGITVWLTAWAGPFIYALWLLTTYETKFLQMSPFQTAPSLRAKVAMLLRFNVRHNTLRSFDPGWGRLWNVGFRDAWRAISERRDRERAQRAAERLAEANLVRFAGVDGADERGRRLDQREFRATAAALDAYGMDQWTEFYPDSRYHDDLLERQPRLMRHITKHLPAEHGITTVVSRSGQSYYAWRRTVTGWCFGVGATRQPPDQWFYDGPEPPSGFPRRDRGWVREDERSVNWGDEPLIAA